ncbi:MAG: zf-HC2 domain-containing protein [Planctomycetota bacterium]
MKCPDVGDLLTEYLDGALDVRAAAAVEKHLAACEACRKHLAELHVVVEELRALPRRPAPSRIAADIASEVEKRLARAPRRPALRSFAGGLALAAAALLIAFGVSHLLRPTQQPLPSPLGELALQRSTERVGEAPQAPLPLSAAKVTAEAQEMGKEAVVGRVVGDTRKGVDARRAGAAAVALSARPESAPARACSVSEFALPAKPQEQLADKLTALGYGELANVLRSKERAAFRYLPLSGEPSDTSDKLKEAPRDKDEETAVTGASPLVAEVLSDYTYIAFLVKSPVAGEAALPAVSLASSCEDPASLRERLAPLGTLYLYERTPDGFAPFATRPAEEEKVDRSAVAPSVLIVTVRNP